MEVGVERGAPGPVKWWGWGDAEKRASIAAGGLAMRRAEVGDAEPAERVDLEAVVMPPPRPLPPAIAEAVGPGAVLSGREHRVRRAAGRSYPDLVRLRAGTLDDAPDAVVLPG